MNEYNNSNSKKKKKKKRMTVGARKGFAKYQILMGIL